MEDERIFEIEQYRQAHEADRHYDRLAWTMGTVLVPVALGVFAFVAEGLEQFSPVVIFILGLVSVVALLAWRSMFEAMNRNQHTNTRPLIEGLEERFEAEAFFREHAGEERHGKHVRWVPTTWYRAQAAEAIRVSRGGGKRPPRPMRRCGVRWWLCVLTLVFAVAWTVLFVVSVVDGSKSNHDESAPSGNTSALYHART